MEVENQVSRENVNMTGSTYITGHVRIRALVRVVVHFALHRIMQLRRKPLQFFMHHFNGYIKEKNFDKSCLVDNNA